MMKTVDGGATWSAWDMTAHASLLVDVYFTTAQTGWVVGGKADPTIDPGPDGRDNIKPVVLFTEDGGSTWVNRVADLQDDFPAGEWGWKIHFVDAQLGFVSLENFNDGAILKTTDGGTHWTRLEVDDPQQNANLEGIGFIDEHRGWVGGWGKPAFEGGQSSVTEDGGASWRNANEIGKFINRFRFIGGFGRRRLRRRCHRLQVLRRTRAGAPGEGRAHAPCRHEVERARDPPTPAARESGSTSPFHRVRPA